MPNTGKFRDLLKILKNYKTGDLTFEEVEAIRIEKGLTENYVKSMFMKLVFCKYYEKTKIGYVKLKKLPRTMDIKMLNLEYSNLKNI